MCEVKPNVGPILEEPIVEVFTKYKHFYKKISLWKNGGKRGEGVMALQLHKKIGAILLKRMDV
jgi:hypothetical protein